MTRDTTKKKGPAAKPASRSKNKAAEAAATNPPAEAAATNPPAEAAATNPPAEAAATNTAAEAAATNTPAEAKTPAGRREITEITDARTMRALSHPVRLALLEVLVVHGPLTATEAGELIGESSTTCSFHLRQLAKYGFVEEVGGGKGRSRPWKMSLTGMRFSTENEDPEARTAATALARLYRERQFERLQTWLETRSAYPLEWREASSNSEYVLWMTPDELVQLNEDLHELLGARFSERLTDPSTRPEGALPVELLTYDYPMFPPQGGAAA
jgi:DNA-binding transcriptional ArsR family regulator